MGNPLPSLSLTAPLLPSVWYLARCCCSGCFTIVRLTSDAGDDRSLSSISPICSHLPYLEVLVSCVVRGTGDEDGWRFGSGMHLGTALPDVLVWLLFMLKEGIEPAGAVRINLKTRKINLSFNILVKLENQSDGVGRLTLCYLCRSSTYRENNISRCRPRSPALCPFWVFSPRPVRRSTWVYCPTCWRGEGPHDGQN